MRLGKSLCLVGNCVLSGTHHTAAQVWAIATIAQIERKDVLFRCDKSRRIDRIYMYTNRNNAYPLNNNNYCVLTDGEESVLFWTFHSFYKRRPAERKKLQEKRREQDGIKCICLTRKEVFVRDKTKEKDRERERRRRRKGVSGKFQPYVLL